MKWIACRTTFFCGDIGRARERLLELAIRAADTLPPGELNLASCYLAERIGEATQDRDLYCQTINGLAMERFEILAELSSDLVGNGPIMRLSRRIPLVWHFRMPW